MKFQKENMGITLIALIITVVIMIILAGLSISAITGTGLFNRANEAKFKSNIKVAQEAAQLYVAERQLSASLDHESAIVTNTGIENLQKWQYTEDVLDLQDEFTNGSQIADKLKNIPEDIREQVIIYKSELYYIWNRTEEDKQRVKWAMQVGVKIWGNNGYDSIEEMFGDIGDRYTSDGRYELVNGVYMCIPDLTGFEVLHTRYVSWDDNGIEKIATWTAKEPPEEWYDYKNKKWANVLVENNGKQAYYVWIPRYVYKMERDKPRWRTNTNSNSRC